MPLRISGITDIAENDILLFLKRLLAIQDVAEQTKYFEGGTT